MKLFDFLDKGIISRSDSFKTFFYDERFLECFPVQILTPYYLDMSVRRIYACNGELLVIVEKGE